MALNLTGIKVSCDRPRNERRAFANSSAANRDWSRNTTPFHGHCTAITTPFLGHSASIQQIRPESPSVIHHEFRSSSRPSCRFFGATTHRSIAGVFLSADDPGAGRRPLLAGVRYLSAALAAGAGPHLSAPPFCFGRGRCLPNVRCGASPLSDASADPIGTGRVQRIARELSSCACACGCFLAADAGSALARAFPARLAPLTETAGNAHSRPHPALQGTTPAMATADGSVYTDSEHILRFAGP